MNTDANDCAQKNVVVQNLHKNDHQSHESNDRKQNESVLFRVSDCHSVLEKPVLSDCFSLLVVAHHHSCVEEQSDSAKEEREKHDENEVEARVDHVFCDGDWSNVDVSQMIHSV